jgi:hypothetical protein
MPFTTGRSGNPKGRPRGSQDRRTLIFNELLPHASQLVSKAVAMALQGDPAMLSLCLNKLIANAKPADHETRIDNFAGSLTERGEQVLGAMARGEVAPSEAAVVLGALSSQAKLIEVVDLSRRVEALEEHAASR